MVGCAGLVYGRTLNVDFRFLVVPDDFGDDDSRWADRFVSSSLSAPEDLAGRPRRVFFRDDRHAVVGVAAMARELFPAGTGPVDVTRDRVSRPTYLFAGYVVRCRPGEAPAGVPPLEAGLAPFAWLVRHVAERWSDQDFNAPRMPRCPYREEAALADLPAVPVPAERLALNVDAGRVEVWPTARDGDLWASAVSASPPVSLCLGLPPMRDVLRGTFLNGTSTDVDTQRSWRRAPEPPRETVSPQAAAPAAPSRPGASPPRRQHAEVTGGGPGEGPSLLSPTLARVIGLLLGGGFGWLLGSALGRSPVPPGPLPSPSPEPGLGWLLGALGGGAAGAGLGWLAGVLVEEVIRRQRVMEHARNRAAAAGPAQPAPRPGDGARQATGAADPEPPAREKPRYR